MCIGQTACFFGHRKITETEELRIKISSEIENLIVNDGINTFLFGSKSQFDNLCHEIVSRLKSKYPHIRRIYVRAEFPHINDDYRSYLLKQYEDTYYPEHLLLAGKATYVERNHEMIEKSAVCVVYYDANYTPPPRKRSKHDFSEYRPASGTDIAYRYAVKKKRRIINMYHQSK